MMGWHKVIGYDGDIIEDHNLSTTAYPLDESGNAKRDSAQGLFQRYSEDWQEFVPKEHFGVDDKITSKMIVCTDDMESRKMVYTRWLEVSHEERAFLIDLRMGATSVEMVTCTSDMSQNYLSTWAPTHTIPAAPCSMKHTVFATNHIVSLGLAQMYNVVAGLAYYDYIWTSLNPNMVEFGTLIKPNVLKGTLDYAEEVSIDTSKKSVDRLDSNAIGIDILNHRSA